MPFGNFFFSDATGNHLSMMLGRRRICGS